MTDPAPDPTGLSGTPPWPPPGKTPGTTPWPTPPATVRPPGTVVAASVITWTLATSTLLGTVLAVPVVLWLGDPIFDVFAEDGAHLRTGFLLLAATVVVASAAADVLAWQVHRGRAWARWALVALSVLAGMAALASAAAFYVPIAITVGCVAVVVLLFIDPSPGSFRRPQ